MIHSFAFIYICQQIEQTRSATAGMEIGSGGHRPSLFSTSAAQDPYKSGNLVWIHALVAWQPDETDLPLK